MNIRKSALAASATGLAATLALAGCASGGPAADGGAGDYSGQTLTVTSFGGDWEEAYLEAVVEPFEAATGAKVELTTLYSADALAQVTAQRGSPQIDVVHFSGGQEHAAAADGLISPIPADALENRSDLIDAATSGLDAGEGPAIQIAPVGLLYRTDSGAPRPSSWKDLFDPAYAGHIALTDFSNSYGVLSMLRIADVEGGSIDDASGAVSQLAGLASSGDAIVVPTSPDLQNAFAQRDTWIAPYAMDYAGTLADAGLPVEFIAPTEGATASRITSNLVAGRPNQELSQIFINYELRPEAQAIFAERMRYTPVNSTAELSPEAKANSLTAEQVSQLVIYDPAKIAEHRQSWTDEWNSLITR